VTDAAGGSEAEESRDPTTTDGTSVPRVHSLGLLRGVDTTVDNLYADEIDMSKEGLAWLSQPGRMWEAAKKDAAEMKVPVAVEEYIQGVEANIETFVSSGIVYDREELFRYLDEAFTSTGTFALLLGGKSVGKSTILKSRCNVSKKSAKLLALYVDARASPGHLEIGLTNGILQLLAEQLGLEAMNWFEAGKGVFRSLGRAAALDYIDGVFKVDKKKNGSESIPRQIFGLVFDSVLNATSGDKAEVSNSLLNKFIKVAKDRNLFPVLVIDEANVVLGIESNGKPDKQTKNLLTSIIKYTKQDHNINLIMASSEHAYPYRLEREGLNLQDVDEIIYAGEISPKEMWALLVSATYEEGDNKGKAIIGMGPHLAELCLAAYGGHIWTVRNAIRGLSLGQDSVIPSLYLPDLSPKINQCLDTNRRSRPLLEAMARYGFAPIKTPNHPAAKIISKENVGGVITQNAACIGVSEAKWEGARDENALIPSSQSVRLRIARVLSNLPVARLFV
jgi:hypothetical protein